MNRVKPCTECTRPMSANDQHRRCQSCRPTRPQKPRSEKLTKRQRDEYNERKRDRRARLRERALLRTWDDHVRAKG